MDAKTTNIIGYVIAALLSLRFLAACVGKLTGGASARFAEWGYNDPFMYFIGVLELLVGIGLWIPQVRKFAAFGIIIIMIGAIYTHIMSAEYPAVGANLFVIGMAFLMMKIRKDI